MKLLLKYFSETNDFMIILVKRKILFKNSKSVTKQK